MDLMERFAAGDLDAFEIVFRRYQGEVYGWIVRIVRDAGTAEDLTMETFWRIYRHRSRYDATRPFGAWARRIATRLALGHLKSARREVALPADLAERERGDPAWERQIRERVAGVFRSLPIRLRVAATLALIEERPYEEIAEALDASTSAIKARVFRAVRILRKKLDQLGIRP